MVMILSYMAESPERIEHNEQHNEQVHKIRNPYRDIDAFRLEAFVRIPGAFRGSGVRRFEATSGHYLVVDCDKLPGLDAILERGRDAPSHVLWVNTNERQFPREPA